MKIQNTIILEKEDQETIKKFEKLVKKVCHSINIECGCCVFNCYCAARTHQIACFVDNFSSYGSDIKLEDVKEECD